MNESRTGHNITDLIVIEGINKKLAEFGSTLDGRPLFRIAWTSDQHEKRIGWHEEYSPSGNIFIRKWFGMKDCLKYSYCMHRWALERLTFLGDNKIMEMEIEGARNGTYELIYLFQDPQGNALPVVWWAVDLIMVCLQQGPGYTRGNEREDLRKKFEENEDKEVEAYLGEIGRSPLTSFENFAFQESHKQQMWSR